MMGAGRRIDQPFVAMLVELVNGEKGAAFYTGLISACGAVGGVIAGFTFGSLSDRYPPEKMLPFIVLGTGLCAFWQGMASDVWSLMIGRFFYYFVAGGMQPVLLIMLSRLTAPEHKGSFFGWSASVNVAGGIITAAVSGVIAYNFGIRAIFFAGGVILISMLIPGIWFFRTGISRKNAAEKEVLPE
jgi:MFS family permease